MQNEKISILVADDDRDILSYFRAVIKAPNIALTLVSNGERALEQARRNHFHLAFIDVNMPGLTGIETLIEWKKIQAKTQVVIISSYSDAELVRTAIAQGAFTYLFKPLNKMDLYSVTVQSLKQAGIQTPLSF